MVKIVTQNFVEWNTAGINRQCFPLLSRPLSKVSIKLNFGFLWLILLFVNFMSKLRLQKLRRDKINTLVKKKGYYVAPRRYEISRCLLGNNCWSFHVWRYHVLMRKLTCNLVDYIILRNHPRKQNAISIWSTMAGQANDPLRRSGNRSCSNCVCEIFTFYFQATSYQTVSKDVSVCGRTLFRLFPDVNCYDVQYVAFCGCCDWSRNGLLRGDATHW